MIDKFCELLEGVKPTIISGVFLAASLILSLCGIDSPVDPAWVSLVISGIPLVRNAVWKILNLNGISKISSALLISIAMLAAIIIGDLFAAAEVAFIMAIGEILEDKTTERARKGLRNLISLAPTQGRRISGGTEEMIPAEDIHAHRESVAPESFEQIQRNGQMEIIALPVINEVRQFPEDAGIDVFFPVAEIDPERSPETAWLDHQREDALAHAVDGEIQVPVIV